MKRALKLLSNGDANGIVLDQWIIWNVQKSGESNGHIKTTTLHALEKRGLVEINRSKRYEYIAKITENGKALCE